jgi:hypothetical protein
MIIEDIIGPSSFVAGFIVATISFYISTKYRKLSLSFVFLGIAFLAYGMAELYWYVLDLEGMEPYQTGVDMMYTIYYLFAILHVIATLKALSARLSVENMALVIIFMAALTGVYIIMSLASDTDDHSFVYGGFFVLLASTLAAFSLVAVIKMYATMLTRTWLIIGTAILMASLTDVWYYTQENITGYEYGQFPLMDILWAVTDIMMVAGIIIHRRKI